MIWTGVHDVYEPAVTERIVERLGLGLRHATSKLALPYALARAKAITDMRAKNPFGIPAPGPIAEPDPNTVAQAQPPSQSFGATTTIEHGVAEAMTSGNFVKFDEAEFGMMYVPQMSEAPRPVELDLERGAGDWKIARVIKPTNATAAEVANALYGSPENANLVAGWGARYSFAFPPSGALAEPYDSMWRERIEQDEGGGPLELIRGRAPSDPLLGLDNEDAELRALDTAAGLPADGDQAAVVQRMEIIQSHLTAISTAAGPLGVGNFVEPMLARIKERMAACAAENAEAQKWSAHSAAQISVLSEVKTGFDAITQQMFATGLPAVSTPEGEQLVGDVTASMQGPTIELRKRVRKRRVSERSARRCEGAARDREGATGRVPVRHGRPHARDDPQAHRSPSIATRRSRCSRTRVRASMRCRTRSRRRSRSCASRSSTVTARR